MHYVFSLHYISMHLLKAPSNALKPMHRVCMISLDSCFWISFHTYNIGYWYIPTHANYHITSHHIWINHPLIYPLIVFSYSSFLFISLYVYLSIFRTFVYITLPFQQWLSSNKYKLQLLYFIVQISCKTIFMQAMHLIIVRYVMGGRPIIRQFSEGSLTLQIHFNL